MGSSQVLYDRLSHKRMAVCGDQTTNIKQIVNLIWLVVGVINARSVALSEIANSWPGMAEAESRVTRIRRWLSNAHVDVWAVYRPLLEQVLAGWYRTKITVVIDGTLVFGDRLQIYRVSLLHGCRAVPLGWIVTRGTGLIEAKRMAELFIRVATFLAAYAQHVTLLADRGFRDHDWAELCGLVGWRYRIRVPKNTIVTFPNGRACRIDQLGVQPGTVRCFQAIRLTRSDPFLTHLAVTWSVGDAQNPPELVAVMTGQHASPKTLRQYARRMGIEQSFRDDKSGGFDLAHTRLHHPERLERLLLAVAIATVWCHELGEHVLDQGEACRRQIDPSPHRELSLFQLGLRWLKRCLDVMIDALPYFHARLSNRRLDPVVKPYSQLV
ncbi:MAG: hypothetical protein KatS3mg053_3200 [Candidatus Roseilinea sp.]|nr:MAG: hypothetical protein KatS3mg053_3200 [Candidatus Roseilinea sp.]